MQLVIENLDKVYPNGVHALNDVNLTINQGMFGLLGPNGAGKSSLMRTIATLQEPDSGSIRLGDIDVLIQKDEVRKTLGYLPQEFGVYPKVDAETLLDHLAVLKGITNRSERKETVKALLQKTNLYDARKKNLGGYSGGMKQRFGIAQALLANPQLIIVDEPTAGLDPAERNRFLNLLSELGENTIVILSTHIVDDVKELCSDMAIFNQGQVLYHGSPQKALGAIVGKIWEKRVPKADLETLRTTHTVISEKLVGGMPVVHVLSDTNPGEGFEAIEGDLEDVYFSYIFSSKGAEYQST
ncbi:ABC transporter ATP-binding protein [Persicitalea jodogahamensis]|uniref:Multidrug ABC transporter ATP-binding protein n=1 Tax=Persicitalea jodogahamensis TaxID=402147 RepID=A0A8J3D6R8_9BACT|nr:ABC transporter ATP-binding protein [Persicitalea jodogahamensis]GHB58500.1 multidrug ABC transporter ATP-binding protein [Persicitalea jodogahamensis]